MKGFWIKTTKSSHVNPFFSVCSPRNQTRSFLTNSININTSFFNLCPLHDWIWQQWTLYSLCTSINNSNPNNCNVSGRMNEFISGPQCLNVFESCFHLVSLKWCIHICIYIHISIFQFTLTAITYNSYIVQRNIVIKIYRVVYSYIVEIRNSYKYYSKNIQHLNH